MFGNCSFEGYICEFRFYGCRLLNRSCVHIIRCLLSYHFYYLSKARGVKGPIFEDGPSFDTAFRLFHGRDGVVPLSGKSYIRNENVEPEHVPQFNPLAAKAATISLSAFGGPFGFNFFSDKWKKLNKKSSKQDQRSQVSFPTIKFFLFVISFYLYE